MSTPPPPTDPDGTACTPREPHAADATRPNAARALEEAQLRRLYRASLAEAVTLLALVGVAVPLKYLAGMPAAVAVLGPLHGLAFLAYCWTAVTTVAGGGWTRGEVGRLVLAVAIPFGGLTNGPMLRRKAAALARRPGATSRGGA